jgi:hypothetical protein
MVAGSAIYQERGGLRWIGVSEKEKEIGEGKKKKERKGETSERKSNQSGRKERANSKRRAVSNQHFGAVQY